MLAGKSGNGGEKTFAIIIGLLAGVAILIIFLAFLRRICEGQGKDHTFSLHLSLCLFSLIFCI